MAGAAARVGEGLPFLGNELPVVTVGAKRQLQNAESCEVANLAVGLRRRKGPMTLSARAGDKLANAASRIAGAVRSLRREAFVVVVMTVDDHVGIGVVECIPERLYSQIVAVSAARTEKWLVPIGQRAGDWMR